ncbi:MAG: RecX family transcriptional regulator [Candidatus Saccharimonadales bacterium]
MKITDIKQQVKRHDRYSIYVDGKYSFSLSGSELLTQGLKIDQEFSSQEFKTIQSAAQADKAYSRAIDLLARRARSTWEMAEYLRRKGYEQNLIDRILSKLSNRGLLDDKQFAKSWVSSRRMLKPISQRRLVQELQQKRISQDIIAAVLAADEIDEKEVLKQLIAKKRGQSRYQDEQKLTAYLMRQGFNYEDIKTAING